MGVGIAPCHNGANGVSGLDLWSGLGASKVERSVSWQKNLGKISVSCTKWW